MRHQHIGLFTNDSKRLIKFYTEILGFKIEKATNLTPELMKAIFNLEFACEMTSMTNDDTLLETFKGKNEKVAPKMDGIIGINHFVFYTQDKEKKARDLESKGVPVIRVKKSEDKVVIFIKDPDDNRIELHNR